MKGPAIGRPLARSFHGRRCMNVRLKSLVAGMAPMPIAAALSTGANASPDKPVIALSDAYYGNT
jgi:hypothetical protein